MIICCTVPEIWCVANVIIFHFGLFFTFNWYIGQIYAIPKFVHEEIEKTIAQLSI